MKKFNEWKKLNEDVENLNDVEIPIKDVVDMLGYSIKSVLEETENIATQQPQPQQNTIQGQQQKTIQEKPQQNSQDSQNSQNSQQNEAVGQEKYMEKIEHNLQDLFIYLNKYKIKYEFTNNDLHDTYTLAEIKFPDLISSDQTTLRPEIIGNNIRAYLGPKLFKINMILKKINRKSESGYDLSLYGTKKYSFISINLKEFKKMY